MLDWVVIGVLISGIGLWVSFGKDQDFKEPTTMPASQEVLQSFELVPSLFVNASERAFFNALRRELPDQYLVFAKVRLEDILRPKRDITDRRLIWQLRGRVKSRHVDFLITHKNGTPCLAIELDGPSHNKASSRISDRIKDGLFYHAGLPLHRIGTSQDFQLQARALCRAIDS